MSRIQGKTTTDSSRVYAGIDVSKATLDLHVILPSGSGHACRFANSEAGIRSLLAWLKTQAGSHPSRVAFEPTWRFHLALWRALDAAGRNRRAQPAALEVVRRIDREGGQDRRH